MTEPKTPATPKPVVASNGVVLQLILTFKWFDLMLAGKKDVEYRMPNCLWTRKIWNRRKSITHIIFHRGYTAATLARKVIMIDMGTCPYDGWDGPYIRIHLEPVENEENQTQ